MACVILPMHQGFLLDVGVSIDGYIPDPRYLVILLLVKFIKKILCLNWLNSIGPIRRLRESLDPFLTYPYWKYRYIKNLFFVRFRDILLF